MATVDPTFSDSQAYYFAIGRGRWRGKFTFHITDRPAFRATSLGFKNRLLLIGMSAMHRVFPDSRIDSEIWAEPESGVAGVAGNTVRISHFGMTLYLLRETYALDANGSDVAVHAHERFGPIPFLLKNEKEHPAEIHADGMSSTYYIPLLGVDWVATYAVAEDRHHIDGRLLCAWAEATEVIHKLDER